MTMQHIYACLCGANQQVDPQDLKFGSVFKCPACSEVRARVRPHRGGDAWIKVADNDVEFYRLLEVEPDDHIPGQEVK